MSDTIAIIGAGAMGSAVAQRLVGGGVHVITYLEGRSKQTVDRALAAGMKAVDLSEIAEANLVLSIVPPSTALAVATSLVQVLEACASKPVYVDLNAINPTTMRSLAEVLGSTGCQVVDGAIIGGPPKKDGVGPTFYISGYSGHRLKILETFLKLRPMDGEIGTASALKMGFSAINKGLTGLGAAVVLAAAQSGVSEELRTAMRENSPEVLSRLDRAIPDMYPKAYRWVGEMLEIAEFFGPDDPASQVFKGVAGIFARFADDRDGDRRLMGEIEIALISQTSGS
jgi:3-hydroxyisobutyrate dehydrogenase-like beta-hydroxyacid dehydrogenase